MANPWAPEKQRGRQPENIRSFEPGIWALRIEDIPADCICPWVPYFRRVLRDTPSPDGTPRPAWCYQMDGWELKFTNRDCTADHLNG